MHKIIQIFLILCYSYACLIYAANNVPQVVLNVPSGETQFSIQLASNPTTGYQWDVLDYDKQLLQVVSHAYLPPQTNRVGAGGREIWLFKVLSPSFQKTVVHFQYARPWNKQDNPRYLDYLVTQG